METGRRLLQRRTFRRNLLFGSTLLTLGVVFLGAVPLNGVLSKSPWSFLLFWTAVLFLVGFVLLLAFYDIIRIRADHRERLRSLERELADASEEAKRLAEETRQLLEEELARDSDAEDKAGRDADWESDPDSRSRSEPDTLP